MVPRTYGRRRSRPIPTTFSDDQNDAVSLSSSFFPFSSQDSNPVADDFCNRKSKRARKEKKEKEVSKNNIALSVPAATSTLMEAQEFGEVMERVDEVNFAIDGLRGAQPVRIRRASLLSLLSTCATAQQRRILRTQGMVKTIIDAILGLGLNDLPSNLAAATLFYILTSDGQDDHLLESPDCVRFLIKLLRPIVSMASEEKAPKFGSKLLALRKNVGLLTNTTRILDSSSVAIFSGVQQILVNCKELKSTSQNDSGVERPELCPKWLALLTIEKACLSAISLDETSGAVQKTGGNFKEKLRELGGLDAIFEITLNCLSDLECWMEDSYLRNDKRLKSLALLLKCLKIMENATFLSEDNQTHLLGLKCKFSPQATPFSFVELVITVIKILSDLCTSLNASTTSNDNKNSNPFSSGSHDSELDLLTDLTENETVINNSIGMYCDMERESSVMSSNLSQKNRLLTCTQLESSLSVSETPSTSMTYNYSPNMRVRSSKFGSCSGASKGSDCKTSMIKVEISDDSQDPFAFDEDNIAPSKWDLLSGKQRKSHSEKYEVTGREFEDGCLSQTNWSREEFKNGDVNYCSSYNGDEEGSSLLTDCLLTAVKVLMNLTNDNPVGCQQIAAYGGLEIMPLLIAGHFPSFMSSSSPSFRIKENKPKRVKDHQYDRHLTDHEIDFLVAILGLLVNLVEKDGHNRSQLAAASVLLPTSEALEQEVRRGVIPLLCSIFLANQGGGEDTEEDKYLLLNDEAAVLQGEKEAEKMIVEAYSALLLAFLSTESKGVRKAIADNLPDHSLSILVPVLDRFVEFHLTLNMISPETHKAVSEVIESCRIQ